MGTKQKRDDGRRTSEVESVVANAFSDIDSLKEELQSWYDNMSENLQGGSKGETLQQSISDLEQDSEPEVPELAKALTVEWREMTGRKAQSRRGRRDNITAAVSCAAEVVRTRAGELQDLSEEAYTQDGKRAKDADDTLPDTLAELEEAVSDMESLADSLEEAYNNWDNAEFPGMYG